MTELTPITRKEHYLAALGGQTNKNGTANTGGGGGGSYGTQYAAGSGGSGIIIIRGGN